MKTFKQFLTESGKARSDKDVLHTHLNSIGFKHDKAHVEDSHRRYIMKGFYDGNHPNAHRTQVHTEKHKFSIKDDSKEHHKALHAHLKSLGYKHSSYKSSYNPTTRHKLIKRKVEHHVFRKGKNRVAVHHWEGVTTVDHDHESTKPDHSYFVPGQVA